MKVRGGEGCSRRRRRHQAPSEAEPMKVTAVVRDASAVATASRGDLRFMPFSEDETLCGTGAELRTLKGHSKDVRCAASAVLL